MQKPRVMQLVLSLGPGGTERLVIEIVKRLSQQVDSIVCCLDQPGAWASEIDALGVPVVSLGRKPGFHPQLAMALARVIKEHRINAVHCHHYSPYVYGLLAAVLSRNVQLVFTEHGRLSDGRVSFKRRLVNPMLAWWPGQLCAVSADLRRHMLKEGFPSRRIGVVYNGIDAGERPTAAARHQARRALGVPDDALVVGAVGRLVEIKRFELLLQAHQQLRASHPVLRTVLVGDGPEAERLQAMASALGVADAVTFAGHRDDARALMAGFDIYVNCSAYEGVSLTILEAMAAALPVVATRVGGNPEVVIDQETGLLVPGTAESIAQAIGSLAGDPGRRRVMGEAGRWRVKRHFSISRMVDQYANAYLGRSTFDGAPQAVNAGA